MKPFTIIDGIRYEVILKYNGQGLKDAWGTRHWNTPEGKLHRVDGPAIIWANGKEEWYLNGKKHYKFIVQTIVWWQNTITKITKRRNKNGHK